MNINHESHAISRRSFLKASGVVGAAGILAACGGSSSSSTAASSGATSAPNTTGATPLKEFISWEGTNRELESWNMLYSQMASDMNVTTNLWEGLLSFDCYGKAVPSVAKEWSHNEDSSVWTFNLRDDVDWVDVNGEVKAHLTSKDFLVGLEWVLNAGQEPGQQHLHAQRDSGGRCGLLPEDQRHGRRRCRPDLRRYAGRRCGR